jgi:hypothetical protein
VMSTVMFDCQCLCLIGWYSLASMGVQGLHFAYILPSYVPSNRTLNSLGLAS